MSCMIIVFVRPYGPLGLGTRPGPLDSPGCLFKLVLIYNHSEVNRNMENIYSTMAVETNRILLDHARYDGIWYRRRWISLNKTAMSTEEICQGWR